jgi:2',3'-cyclic-nucleotide 2'-phosphodiesterase (5'-nucleotidase family)
MRKTLITICLICITGILQAQVSLNNYERIEIDSRYDTMVNPEMKKVFMKYKTSLENQVMKTIGESEMYMDAKAPESLLSNFLADELLKKANEINSQKVDLAIINFGGIRAPLNKGKITVSDIYKIMPFENELVIVNIKGSDLKDVLNNIAEEGGEGVSNIRLEISGKNIESLQIAGEPFDENKEYVVATMDYLAEGNSGMNGFLKATKRFDTHLKVRDVYISQIEKITASGGKVTSSLDGRIRFTTK